MKTCFQGFLGNIVFILCLNVKRKGVCLRIVVLDDFGGVFFFVWLVGG